MPLQNKEERKMEGTMYLNNRPGKDNGRTAKVVRYDNIAKTVILQYVDDSKNVGPISVSTLKRWWKKSEEQTLETEDTEVQESTNTTDISTITEDVSSDGTPYSQVMQEIIQDGEKTKQSIKKVAKSEPEPWVDEALQFIFNFVKDNQDEVFTPANGIKMRSLKTGGHMYAKIDFSGKSVTVAVKSIAVKNDTPTKRINHMFDYGYVFKSELSATDKELIHKLLTDSRDYRISKNNKKEEK